MIKIIFFNREMNEDEKYDFVIDIFEFLTKELGNYKFTIREIDIIVERAIKRNRWIEIIDCENVHGTIMNLYTIKEEITKDIDETSEIINWCQKWDLCNSKLAGKIMKKFLE